MVADVDQVNSLLLDHLLPYLVTVRTFTRTVRKANLGGNNIEMMGKEDLMIPICESSSLGITKLTSHSLSHNNTDHEILNC